VSEKASKEEPRVLVEAEKIIQKEQFGKGVHQPLAQPYEAPFGVSTHRQRAIVSLPDYWYQMLASIRRFPQIEFGDEITEMRREIDTLRYRTESVEQELSSCKQTIDELRKEVYGRPSTKLASVGELCEAYVEIVSGINIVRQVFLCETNNIATIWTIIDATPFEDSLRTPIYDAQVKILSTLKENIPLDFYVLNVSELSEGEELKGIIPSNAKLVWEQ